MFEQSLLGVQAILGLVPRGGALAVEHVLGDLLTRVGGQAVEDDRVVARPRKKLGVDPVGRQELAAAEAAPRSASRTSSSTPRTSP